MGSEVSGVHHCALRGVDYKAVCARHGVVYVNKLDLQVADFQFLSRSERFEGDVFDAELEVGSASPRACGMVCVVSPQ